MERARRYRQHLLGGDAAREPGNYGNGASGNVKISNGAAVGSFGGTTTVAAADLTLDATTVGFNGVAAQVGYSGDGAHGNINVALNNNLTLTPAAATAMALAL